MNITFYGGFNSMLRKEGIEKTLDFTAERGFSSVEYLDFPSKHTFTDDEARALKSSLDAHKLTCDCAEEVVAIARRIETFDTSILPFEDCCTVFTPKHPKTRPDLEKVIA